MKKQLTLALFIAALLGILSIGCNRTNEEYTCNPSCERGGKLLFGKYNGSPIEWYIMSNDTVNRRFMLLAMDPLEQRAFHEELAPVTWERSTIRSWLNGYGPRENDLEIDYTSDSFISQAFTRKEKAWIHKTTVVNNGNSDLGMGGTPTKDYVFLLNKNELVEFIPETAQAWPGHTWPGHIGGYEGTKLCTKIRCKKHWWLRDSTDERVPIEGEVMNAHFYGARYVNSVGAVGYVKFPVLSTPVNGLNYYNDGTHRENCPYVRPALWMNY